MMEDCGNPSKIRKLTHSGPDPPLRCETPTLSGSQPSGTNTAESNEHESNGNTPSASEGVTPLSKNAQKRLRKQQAWEARQPQRLELRKQQRIAKRERKKEARSAAIASGEIAPGQPKAPIKHIQLPVTFIIDCDFDDLMQDKERRSLGLQIQRCYADNRQAPFMNHLTIASFGGELKNRYDSAMRKHYESWKGVRFLSDDFLATAHAAEEWMSGPKGGELAAPVFAKAAESDETMAKAKECAEIIYLSSDSDHTLTELKPYSTYIIGGLVDKNREKGICHKRAVAKGVKTARLPIGDYLEMASRKVLTTNQVHEIMLRWLELGDWGEAFMSVIPKRKEAKLKNTLEDGDEEGVEQDETARIDADGDIALQEKP